MPTLVFSCTTAVKCLAMILMGIAAKAPQRWTGRLCLAHRNHNISLTASRLVNFTNHLLYRGRNASLSPRSSASTSRDAVLGKLPPVDPYSHCKSHAGEPASDRTHPCRWQWLCCRSRRPHSQPDAHTRHASKAVSQRNKTGLVCLLPHSSRLRHPVPRLAIQQRG
jgi:hypothetical protein